MNLPPELSDINNRNDIRRLGRFNALKLINKLSRERACDGTILELNCYDLGVGWEIVELIRASFGVNMCDLQQQLDLPNRVSLYEELMVSYYAHDKIRGALLVMKPRLVELLKRGLPQLADLDLERFRVWSFEPESAPITSNEKVQQEGQEKTPSETFFTKTNIVILLLLGLATYYLFKSGMLN